MRLPFDPEVALVYYAKVFRVKYAGCVLCVSRDGFTNPAGIRFGGGRNGPRAENEMETAAMPWPPAKSGLILLACSALVAFDAQCGSQVLEVILVKSNCCGLACEHHI